MREAEEIAKMQTALKYIEKTLSEIKKITDESTLKQHNILQEIWELKRKVPEIDVKVDEAVEKHEKSTIRYFIKNNWWKVGGSLLAFSTILGAIGEYLYHLPPPIKK